MDGLRSSISLRVYAQRDPLVEYKNEAYNIFKVLMDRIYRDITGNLFRATLALSGSFEELLRSLPQEFIHEELGSFDAVEDSTITVEAMDSADSAPQISVELPITFRRMDPKVGRNDPCPCGSGKKYKKCCGRYDV